jgi:hypothetical protein
MRVQLVERHMKIRIRTIALSALIVAASSAVGLALPSRAVADAGDAAKWKCSATENECLGGSKAICQVGCDLEGCGCDAWDPM